MARSAPDTTPVPTAGAPGLLSGAVEELIVYFGNRAWYGPVGTSQQMARALSRYAPLLYVEPAVSPATALRNPAYAASLSNAPRLEILGPRLARVTTYVMPGMTRPVLHHLTAPLVRRATRAAVRRLYGRDAPVAALVSTRVDDLWRTTAARRRVFYATDDLPAGAELLGNPRERLLREEARTLRGADAVAVVSSDLCDRYAAGGHNATMVPNGCQPEAYDGVDDAALPGDVSLPGPVAGFVGFLNARIDLTLLEAVADAGISLLLVGGVVPGYASERLTALTARPNVRWVGSKPFAELPPYLRLIDVGLTPYADTAFNRSSFPLKTLEYLAAGRGVVSSPLPANDWLGTDLVTVAKEPTEFVARVRAELAKPRTPALVLRRRAFAREHSWTRRAEVFAGLLGLPAAPDR